MPLHQQSLGKVASCTNLQCIEHSCGHSHKLFRQDEQAVVMTQRVKDACFLRGNHCSPASAEAVMMSLDLSPSVWLKLIRLPTGTSATKLMLIGVH